MIVFIYSEVKIVGLGEADHLAVLRGCPGIPGAAGPKGEPGLSGKKGIRRYQTAFSFVERMCGGDTPYPWESLKFFTANSYRKQITSVEGAAPLQQKPQTGSRVCSAHRNSYVSCKSGL